MHPVQGLKIIQDGTTGDSAITAVQGLVRELYIIEKQVRQAGYGDLRQDHEWTVADIIRG